MIATKLLKCILKGSVIGCEVEVVAKRVAASGPFYTPQTGFDGRNFQKGGTNVSTIPKNVNDCVSSQL